MVISLGDGLATLGDGVSCDGATGDAIAFIVGDLLALGDGATGDAIAFIVGDLLALGDGVATGDAIAFIVGDLLALGDGVATGEAIAFIAGDLLALGDGVADATNLLGATGELLTLGDGVAGAAAALATGDALGLITRKSLDLLALSQAEIGINKAKTTGSKRSFIVLSFKAIFILNSLSKLY